MTVVVVVDDDVDVIVIFFFSSSFHHVVTTCVRSHHTAQIIYNDRTNGLVHYTLINVKSILKEAKHSRKFFFFRSIPNDEETYSCVTFSILFM